MKLPLASNPISVQVAGEVNQIGERLSGVFERLSSGLRINGASDDAAGLQLASSINADAKVFEQGVRNINDGISLVSIADAALTELSNILAKQKELATSAANGALTFSERDALDEEFNALVDEFNRIIETTEFNNQNILEDPDYFLQLQGGYGALGSIASTLNNLLSRSVGALDFSAASSVSVGASTGVIGSIVADFNGDGILDFAAPTSSGRLDILTGDGDGTFTAFSSISLAVSATINYLATGDVDGDGDIDIAIQYFSADTGNEETSILINDGSANFTETNLVSVVAGGAVYIMDVNDDGVDDIVEASNGDAYIWNGAGFTSSAAGLTTSTQENPGYVGDFNNDGVDDLYYIDFALDGNIQLGNGDGTFQSAINLANYGTERPLIGDVDGDGILDVLGRSGSTVTVYSGNGDGSFTASNSFTATTGLEGLADLNSDGILDLYFNSGITATYWIGDDTGSFSAGSSDGGIVALNPSFHDFNGDGAMDFYTENGQYVFYLGNTESSTRIAYQDLHTQDGATDAIDATDDALDRVTEELGQVGGFLRRLESAVSELQVRAENFRAAGSKILDADLAQETAELVRLQVIQNAATAVLAQANLQPEVVLSLLDA